MNKFFLFFVFCVFFFNCQKNIPTAPNISTNIDSLITLGWSFLNEGEYESAEQSFLQADLATIYLLQKKDSTKGKINFDLGMTYLYLGEDTLRKGHSGIAAKYFEIAIEHFEIAIQLLPENDFQKSYSHSNINHILASYGDSFKKKYTRGIENYKKAIIINGQNRISSSFEHKEIGILYRNIGEYNKSLYHYDKVITGFKKSVPNNEEILGNDLAMSYIGKAEIYRLKKQFAQAIVQIEESEKNWIFHLANPSAVIYTEWGNIYHDMGKYLS